MVAAVLYEVTMSDNKLPARYTNPASPPATVDRVHPQISEQSLLGRVVSGFIARLNTHTIEQNTGEINAQIAYASAVEKLAGASLARDRAVALYRHGRDSLIADDLAEHEHKLKINQLRREREEREHKRQDELAEIRHQTARSEAQRLAARAQWGHDAFTQSLPHRQERLDHLFKTGALDAEIEFLMTDEQRTKLAGSRQPNAPPERREALEQMLEALMQEIDLSRATHASADVMIALEGFRARLETMIKEEPA
jgi:hypothetical protein